MSGINLVCKDVILVSYPKSGRTWLRMMLAKILKDTGVDTDKNEMILCTHKNYNDIVKDYGKDKKIIFLIRDPGDVVVSQFRELEATKPWRLNEAPTISRFIRGIFIREGSVGTGGMPRSKDGVRRAGINALVSYMNKWFSDLRNVNESKIITYEEMKEDTFSVLKEVIEFIGYKCDDKDIKNAVEYASFSNMRKIEEDSINENNAGTEDFIRKLKKHEKRDNKNLLRKYKGNFGKEKQVSRVRQGKVRGYISELEQDDVLYINILKKQFLRLPLKLKLRGVKY